MIESKLKTVYTLTSKEYMTHVFSTLDGLIEVLSASLPKNLTVDPNHGGGQLSSKKLHEILDLYFFALVYDETGTQWKYIIRKQRVFK